MLERRRDPDLDTVCLWFEFQKALIGEERGGVFRSLLPGGGSSNNPRHERFIGQTRQEVDEFFNRQTAQLELLTMFELLATSEAILRIDFESRVAARKKDRLSRRFRDIRRRRGVKIRLDEDILAEMKTEGIGVSGFRGLLNLRDWLAHGRHWSPKLGGNFTPYIVFDISKALVDSIPV